MARERVPLVPLAELVTAQTEKIVGQKDSALPYVGLEHMASDNPDLIGTAHSSTSTSTNSVFEEGDVLFGKLRPYLRKSIGAPFRGYCSTDILVLRPVAGVEPSFAAKIFQTNAVFAEAVATSVGTKMPRTSWAALRNLLVYCPPLGEQRRIAEILDTVDEAIRKTEEVIAKLQQMKQGLLHDLLTRGIDDNGELRDPDRHPEQFKNSPLGLVPKHWIVDSAAALCKKLTVGVVNSATHAYVPAGVPFVRSQNIRPNRIDTGHMLFVTNAFNQVQSKSILRANDVVVVRTGYPGTAAVVPESLDGANCFSLVIARPEKRLNPYFLAQFMNSPLCKAEIGRMHFGSAQHNFNVGEMRRLPIPLPPLDEQCQVLDVIASAESREQRELMGLEKLRSLKHGLMDDLLTGRVRVNVAAAEEDAA